MKKIRIKKIIPRKIQGFISLYAISFFVITTIFIKIVVLSMALQMKQYHHIRNQENMFLLKKSLVKYIKKYENIPFMNEDDTISYEGEMAETPRLYRYNHNKKLFKFIIYSVAYKNPFNEDFKPHENLGDMYLFGEIINPDGNERVPIYITEILPVSNNDKKEEIYDTYNEEKFF